ncbi:MAG: hypothetical protein ABI457_00680 [Hyphomicrobium sp.]
MRLWIAGAFLGALALLAAFGTAQAGDCMRANEAGAIAEGKLIERDDAIILKMPEPMCLEGPEDSDNVSATAEIHVYSLDDKIHGTLRGLIGKDVHLEGTFMGAMTQHHKAPIVMQVTAADEI